MVSARNNKEKKEIELIKDQLCSEINIKEVRVIDDESNILIKEIKPNYKNLGPKYGNEMKDIVNKINSFGLKQIKEIEANGSISLLFKGKNITLDIADVEIISKDIDGYAVASSQGITVALDIKLSKNLINEGRAREIVNRLQNLRKNSGFKVTDKIEIAFSKNKIIEEIINKNKEYIKNETLAKKITFDQSIKSETKVVFEKKETYMKIKKT